MCRGLQRAGERARLRADAAEFIALPAALAVPLPDNTSFAAGACFGIPALTAWQAVAVDGGVRGKTVLVAGGAGAVGHYAIQFAKAAGDAAAGAPACPGYESHLVHELPTPPRFDAFFCLDAA